MPVRRRLTKAQARTMSISIVKTDAQGRKYYVMGGGLPDRPLGELRNDEERNRAMVEAAKPHRIYLDRR